MSLNPNPISGVSLTTGFIAHRKLTLKADGRHIQVPATGSMFICKEANYPFEMQFDEQQWFPFDQGLEFNLGPDRQFTRLNFRSKNTDADTNIEFYVGNAKIGDSRLNIVRDPNHYQIFSFTVAKTVIKTGSPLTIGAGGTIILPDIVAGLGYRKSAIITNLDPALDLDVLDSTGNPIGCVFFRQAHVFETSAYLVLMNSGGSAMTIRVMEIFYLP